MFLVDSGSTDKTLEHCLPSWRHDPASWIQEPLEAVGVGSRRHS